MNLVRVAVVPKQSCAGTVSDATNAVVESKIIDYIVKAHKSFQRSA